MTYRALLKNPITQRRMWFSLPLYFGQLTRIGLTGDYKERIIVEELEGNIFFPPGSYLVEDLEHLNREVESK